jgi:hypothetical protein
MAVAACLVVALCVSAAQADLAISLLVRETGQGGGADVGIGNNGGSAGGIEFIHLDGQFLPLDGNWYQFSFDLANANANGRVTAFAGTTANSILEGNYGVLEAIRIRNTDSAGGPISMWIDDVANTIQTPPFPASTTTFGDFEAQALGTEHIFQEPTFSGSTAGQLELSPNVSTVVDDVAFAGNQSYNVQWDWVNPAVDTQWLRLTTFNTPSGANPLVRFDQNSVVSVWLRATPEPTSLALLGLGGLAVLRRRR